MISVEVTRSRTRAAIAILPGKESQNQLRRNEDDTHQYVGNGKMVVDDTRGGRSSRRQPPCFSDEEIGAGESDQPDDKKNNEAHEPRPPELEPFLLCSATWRNMSFPLPIPQLQTGVSLSYLFVSASEFLGIFAIAE